MKACMWTSGTEEGENSKERVKTQAASKIKASWRSYLETKSCSADFLRTDCECPVHRNARHHLNSKRQGKRS